MIAEAGQGSVVVCDHNRDPGLETSTGRSAHLVAYGPNLRSELRCNPREFRYQKACLFGRPIANTIQSPIVKADSHAGAVDETHPFFSVIEQYPVRRE